MLDTPIAKQPVGQIDGSCRRRSAFVLHFSRQGECEWRTPDVTWLGKPDYRPFTDFGATGDRGWNVALANRKYRGD
jgi:hypothetical protein